MLKLFVRRFRCERALCTRRIFSERLTAATPWARRTARSDEIVYHLGLALGGRPAASFAQRLRLPVSNDTLLRVVRRRGTPAFTPPQAVGIDDWAEQPKVPPAQQVEWQRRGGSATIATAR